MKVTEKTPIYNIHTINEIVARILEELERLDPLSGFYTELKVVANNATEPEVIYVKMEEELYIQEEHRTKLNTLFDYFIDQNTPYEAFYEVINSIIKTVNIANYSHENRIFNYYKAAEQRRKAQEEAEKEIPF